MKITTALKLQERNLRVIKNDKEKNNDSQTKKRYFFNIGSD